MKAITGQPYAEVIGDPVAHSKSPMIHRFWLKKLGIDADYRTAHVKPDELADYFADRAGDPDWMGCNVTIPHKIAALDHVQNEVDGLSPCLIEFRFLRPGSNPLRGQEPGPNSVDQIVKRVCRVIRPVHDLIVDDPIIQTEIVIGL